MNLNFAVEALDHLGKSHFSRTWPMDSIKAIGPDLEEISEKAMTATVKRAMVDLSPASFPALKRVLDILKEEQKKINQLNSPSDPLPRYREDQEFASRFGEKATEHQFLATKLCLKIAAGEMKPADIIAAMGHMETKFPGVGWKTEQAFWIQCQRGAEQ